MLRCSYSHELEVMEPYFDHPSFITGMKRLAWSMLCRRLKVFSSIRHAQANFGCFFLLFKKKRTFLKFIVILFPLSSSSTGRLFHNTPGGVLTCWQEQGSFEMHRKKKRCDQDFVTAVGSIYLSNKKHRCDLKNKNALFLFKLTGSVLLIHLWYKFTYGYKKSNPT